MTEYNRYQLACDCGKIIEVDSNDYPEELAIVACPKCGDKTLVKFAAGSNYKIRPQTVLIQSEIIGIFDELKPRLTVRQVFYALTVRDVVPKTEAGYRQTVYHLAAMRKRGILPYSYIADNTRWHIKPETYPSLDAALDGWQQAYRRDQWRNQSDYVEIWVEKDALAGVISPITQEFDVPLYIARGYGSLTFIYEAAQTIRRVRKRAFIYHFGDFDPSGVDAAEKIQEGLSEHGATFVFERVAITEPQIYKFGLPTRETKKSDPRAKNWGSKPSVELDALPAPRLRQLVRDCIERHIEPERLEATLRIEKLERNTLAEISKNFVQEQNSVRGGGNHD